MRFDDACEQRDDASSVYALAPLQLCSCANLYLSTFCRLIILWLAFFSSFRNEKPKQKKNVHWKCARKKNAEIKCKEAEVIICMVLFRVYVREYIASEILDTYSYCHRRAQKESTNQRIVQSTRRTKATKLQNENLTIDGQWKCKRGCLYINDSFVTAVWIKSSTDKLCGWRLHW